uniref:Uncharacterized protein n=1 Tax=Meleagris gallopavo TaxID=9103 RepID=A0A803YBC8_MELGA
HDHSPPPLQLVAGGNFRVLKEPLGFIKVLENREFHPKMEKSYSKGRNCSPKIRNSTPKWRNPIRRAGIAPQSIGIAAQKSGIPPQN